MTAGTAASSLLQTPMFALHERRGARIVPFAGYAMPVQYPAGILKEHLHTRAAAGLFDVSHMGQATLAGPDAAAALETLVPGDIQALKPGRMRYTLLLNDAGGILDDLMVTRLEPRDGEERLFLVVNAACKDQDFAHIEAALAGRARLTRMPERALIALQGPKAEAVLAAHAPDCAGLSFMQGSGMDVSGAAAFVTRSGYTGEDGFEISVSEETAERVAEILLAHDDCLPVGLGARDTLRLEAGLCLYGHDIDAGTDPVTAGLQWAIGKRRKIERGFPGDARILNTLMNGPVEKRVGLKLEGRAPAREGAEVVDADGAVVGRVTSGGFAPSLDAPIAMAYVRADLATDGTELGLMVRGRRLEARVTPMPFVPNRYKR